MDGRTDIYGHALVTPRAGRALCALLTAFVLVVGLWSVPAHAADGVVTGTVTDAEGNALSGVPVAVTWSSDPSSPDWDEIYFEETGSAGGYTISVPPGTVRVYVLGDADHAGEWFDDVASYEEATALSLASEGTVTADAELAAWGHVEGHVGITASDPRAGAVALLDPETGTVLDRATIGANGDYAFDQVPPGSYKVSFNRLSGFAVSAAQFWDSEPEHAGVGVADVVSVDSGETVTGVDAALVEGGHITGALEDGAGNPLACRVQAFTSDRRLVTRSVLSGPDGSFDISGLSTGSYLVRVVRSGECRSGTQYRSDGGGPLTGSVAQADPVAVVLGGTASAGAALVYQSPVLTNTYPPAVFVVPAPVPGFEDRLVVGAPLGVAVGGWSPTPASYTFAWLRDGAPIPGATAQTYVPVVADVGKLISVRVRASRPGHQSGTATSPAIGPVAPPAISNTILPRITGSIRVGRYAQALPGSWSVLDPAYTYTWRSGSTVLHTSTDPRFLVPATARRQGLSVTVTASKPGYATGTATSIGSPVQVGIFQKMKMLTLRGEARVGQTLKAAIKVSPTPKKAVFVWERDGMVIVGARGKRYTLVEADVGHRVTVRVRFVSPGFMPLKLTSKHTAPVEL